MLKRINAEAQKRTNAKNAKNAKIAKRKCLLFTEIYFTFLSLFFRYVSMFPRASSIKHFTAVIYYFL
jgi:hypothetical protein